MDGPPPPTNFDLHLRSYELAGEAATPSIFLKRLTPPGGRILKVDEKCVCNVSFMDRPHISLCAKPLTTFAIEINLEFLLTAECPAGFSNIDGECYMIVNSLMTWGDAIVNCYQHNSNLVCITSESQNSAIGNYLKAHNG